MKIKILILLSFFLFPQSNLLLQEIPDCMCMPHSFPPNMNNYNSDSTIVYDTCGIQQYSPDCDSTFWLNLYREEGSRERLYAKKFWDLWFDVKAFPTPYYDKDTTIILTWNDVDSVNYPEIKDSLEQIASDYGNYILFKVHPDLVEPDGGQKFFVYFDDYVNALELESKFNSIEYANCDYSGFPSADVGVDKLVFDDQIEIIISPNPVIEYLYINSDFIDYKIIEIYTISGKSVYRVYDIYNRKNFNINVSHLNNGLYFIRINGIINKFIKD